MLSDKYFYNFRKRTSPDFDKELCLIRPEYNKVEVEQLNLKQNFHILKVFFIISW